MSSSNVTRGAAIATVSYPAVGQPTLLEEVGRSHKVACPAVLPDWPIGTVMILSTNGDKPHAIPISAALRADERRVLIALAVARESLARLRADARVALTILSEGDLALTAHGRGRVVDEALVEGVVAVEIEVERVQDHGRSTFAVDAGVSWRWTDPLAEARDAEVRGALARLGGD